MQIAVIGAGIMGCVYGGNLARIGEQVTLIDVCEEHIDRIRTHGLQLEGLNGDFTVRVGATARWALVVSCDAEGVGEEKMTRGFGSLAEQRKASWQRQPQRRAMTPRRSAVRRCSAREAAGSGGAGKQI